MKNVFISLGIVVMVSILGAYLYQNSPDPLFDIPLVVLSHPYSGGETTIFSTSREAFAKPLANLPTADLRKFTFGNKMFNTNWVQAPASVKSLDGLGPTYNQVSCSSCHFKDGRGRPPHNREEPIRSLLFRLSISGKAEDGGPLPHRVYGGQLNPLGIQGVPGEGKVMITYEEITGHYSDGSPYSLRKPTYHFSDMFFGDLEKDVMFSARVGPAVFGLGLLEAIPDETILSWADPEDQNGDAISGKPNYVPDIAGERKVGRFGWKANVATLRQQDAGAALGDIGITTSVHLKQNCPEPQKECLAAFDNKLPEMEDKQLDRLEFYSRTLAPPARRDVKDPEVQLGARLFVQHRCVSCHVPHTKTGEHVIPQLSHQKIQAFTDLLLHDMGEDLADHRPDYEAEGREWRTPPLWGIGLVKTVNHHTYFLHDGRARNLEEAILWHGGEAEKAKQGFMQMNKSQRAALIRFLGSL